MRVLPLLALICLFLFGFTSCDRPVVPTPPSGTTVPTTSQDPVLAEKVGGLEKQLAEAIKVRDAAIASGDRLKTLEASKNAAADEAALYRQKAAELDTYGKTLDKQIRQERESIAQVKLWIASGILAVIGGIALGLGLWWEMKRLIIGGVVALGLSALCLTLAALVPYAIWIGATFLVGGIAALVIFLIRRHNALHQVVGALEASKTGGGPQMVIENYKTFLPQHLDTASEDIITRIRAVAAKAKTKAEAKAKALAAKAAAAKILQG